MGWGWGGADDVQVSSKTDLRIHKTKGWGGVGCTGQEQDRLEDTQDQRPGGAGWGGADDVQVSSKTDLRIHKTKGWGGVGWS